MDEIDRKLIGLLRTDSRESVSALAARLKVSRGTIQNRIDRMLARGDIQGFTIRTRPDAEDQRIRAIMCINIEGERSAAVVRALRGFKQVEAIHSTNGRWDLIAELVTESLAEFSRTLDDIRLIEGIAQTETNILLATQRF
ncbi:MAG TPA: Lrp/AsnC family transcriptional regulator [Phenylobacterium sp.]